MVRWRFWVRDKPKGDREEARRQYNSKNYELAEPHLRRLLQSDSKDEWSLDVLSRLLMNTGRHEEAIVVLNKIGNNGPDSPAYQFRLARCFAKTEQNNEAIQLLNNMITNSVINDEAWDLLENLLNKEFEMEEIDEFWKKLSQSNVSAPQIDLQMIRIDLQNSELTAAAQRIQKVTDISGEIQLSDKWKLKLADVLLQQGTPDIAHQIIINIPEDTPNRARLLIKAKSALGDNEGAIQTAAEALENTSEHGVIFASLRLAWDLGYMEEVVNFANQIIIDKPAQRVAHRFRLRALVKIGDVTRIIAATEESLEALPDFVDAHRVIIDIGFSESEDWQLVIKHCEAILEIEPTDRRSLCHLVHSLLQLKNYDKALEFVEEALQIHPDNDEVDLTAAQVHWKVGDGQHIDYINRMLTRHSLNSITSTAQDQNISVENLLCKSESKEVSKQPLVTVIMTVYGRDEYLDVAIDSILNQTHRNIELIVVDDRSPDDAFEHLKERAKSDSRMIAIQVEKNGGTYCAKNSAISIASGEYIAFMDSDDWTHPQRIERQLSSLKGTNYRAVCHSYFRINEFGDIFYKGVGAIRLACISLLADRGVFEILGHFDSMRVGADTEFIERIKAVWGADALLHDPLPSMFMLNHSTSLTGGGPFQISWRSITGPRLEHHSSFKAWHKRIRHSGWAPYVAHPLRVRPYEIPEEMISGDLHWNEQMPLFSERIALRDLRWWRSSESAPWQGQLSEKSAGLLWAKQQGIRTPEILWSGSELSEIPSLSQLPRHIVIKPSKGYSAKNVLCLTNGVNLWDGKKWTDEDIQRSFGSDEFLQRVKPTWMVEEYLKPEPWREDERIPRDWKFYCFGGQIALIHVVLRNSIEDKSANVHHYFSSDLRQFKRKICSTRPVPADPLFFPDCWDEMVAQVTKLGEKLDCFMRIDMYATENGPVLGEFTPTPEGGKGFSEWADKYLATYWKGLEGVEG
ncbi:MAG: glycosyltransferase [Candidatus Thalassarchaeaceae archaeon]|nr:glycosyltransferase [Candidatus Thalassarchaeaceae archaeon]